MYTYFVLIEKEVHLKYTSLILHKKKYKRSILTNLWKIILHTSYFILQLQKYTQSILWKNWITSGSCYLQKSVLKVYFFVIT